MASPLTEAQIEAKQRLQRLIVALVGASWAQLGHYDRQQVDQWLTTVLPLVAAAKQQSAALTQAYLARALDAAPPALDVQSIIAGIRNGATPQEVYTRPFITVWGALKRGVPWTQAVQMGRERAVAAAAMDVQLTFTHTVRAFGSVNDRIAGWQRVPDSSACDFCRAAADLIYHTGDLMPLHTWCGCSVAPLGAADLRGPVLRLPDTFSAGDGTTVAIHQHGELGPVLTNAADHFTSQGDLPGHSH